MRRLIGIDDVPELDRFRHYREALLRMPVPLESRSARLRGFEARVASAPLGRMTLTTLWTRSDGPYDVARTPGLIRRSDPEAYRLVVNVHGAGGLSQDGRDAVFGDGDLALYDTSRPFHGWRGSAGVPAEWLLVTFPRDMMPLPESVTRPMTGVRMSGRTGVGALVSGYVERLVSGVDRFTGEDALGLSNTFVDLTAILVAHAAGEAAPAADRRTLMVRIQAFIRNRLGDPALGPGMIAAAHNMSTRQLHRMFQAYDLTVAGWIRESRLQRCKRDLADPLLRRHAIHRIAARWCFTDAAHFSRLFRGAFGVSPQAFRNAHPPLETRPS